MKKPLSGRYWERACQRVFGIAAKRMWRMPYHDGNTFTDDENSVDPSHESVAEDSPCGKEAVYIGSERLQRTSLQKTVLQRQGTMYGRRGLHRQSGRGRCRRLNVPIQRDQGRLYRAARDSCHSPSLSLRPLRFWYSSIFFRMLISRPQPRATEISCI